MLGEFAAFAKRVDFILSGRSDADRLIARQFNRDLLPRETVSGVDECLGFTSGGLYGGRDR